MIKRLISGLISLAMVTWIGVIAYDYFLVTSEKDPQFCLESGINQYPDGTVQWCKGFGYKAFNYKRSSVKAIQFGPFWIKEQTIENGY